MSRPLYPVYPPLCLYCRLEAPGFNKEEDPQQYMSTTERFWRSNRSILLSSQGADVNVPTVTRWQLVFTADVNTRSVRAAALTPPSTMTPPTQTTAGLPDVVFRLRLAVAVLSFPLHPPAVCAVAGPCRRLGRVTKKKKADQKKTKAENVFISATTVATNKTSKSHIL